MATNLIDVNGNDLDDVFEPRGTSTKRADVNVDSNGAVDISNRFYSLTEGGSQISYNTGIQGANGSDLRALFAGIGTVGGQVVLPADFTIASNALVFGGTPQTATATLEVRTTGDLWGVGNTFGDNDVGDWIDTKTGLVPSDYQARVTIVSGGLNVGLLANTWYTLSSTRSWGITITSSGNAIQTTVIDLQIIETANHANTDTVRITLRAEIAT